MRLASVLRNAQKSLLMKALLHACALLGAISVSSLAAPTGGDIKLAVDAREISRVPFARAVEISPRLPSSWYPKWIPGVHAPAGPVQNSPAFALKRAEG